MQSYSIQPVWPFKLAENLKLITYTIIPLQHIPAFGEGSNSTIQANWLVNDNKWLVPVGGGGVKTFLIGKSKQFYCGRAQLFYNVARPE